MHRYDDRDTCRSTWDYISPMQLHATQARHMHIGDQAGGVINVIRTKEIFG